MVEKLEVKDLKQEIMVLLEDYKDLDVEWFNQYKEKLVFDFQKLISINFQIGEQLILNPTNFFDVVQELTGKYVKIVNLNKSLNVSLNNIREEHLERFISLKGVIRFAGQPKILIEKIIFKCPLCGKEYSKLQVGKKVKRVSTCGCGRKGLVIKKFVRTNIQRLLLEEPLEDVEGNNPRSLNVVLKKDLLDPTLSKTVIPGNKVLLYGVLKSDDEVLLNLETDYLFEANNLFIEEDQSPEVLICDHDKVLIREEVVKDGFFEKLINSIAPHIKGLENVKAGLILQAISGYKVKKSSKVEANLLHVLIIGDPGVAKTELAKSVKQVVVKYRYANGTGATPVGLLASAEKDEFFGGWVVKAGAIVMAHKGLINIDEFDKMPFDTQKLLNEALSECTITKDAGSIHTTLKCETKVLAVANPKYGRFDPMSSLSGQINMDSSLLNRFDLIYLLQDKPSDKDFEIINLISETFMPETGCERRLFEKNVYSSDFMKKFVLFASSVSPKSISSEAKAFIAEKYAYIRKLAFENTNSAIALSARQGNTIFKLAICFARLRLSEEVCLVDAQRAFNVLMDSLKDVAVNPITGLLDVDVIEIGGVVSDKKFKDKLYRFIAHLDSGESLSFEDLKEVFKDLKISDSMLERELNNFKRDGLLYEPKAFIYKKM